MPDLLETSDNGITTLTLNRPERLNALSPAMTSGLREALERLSHMGVEAFTGHRIVKAFGTEAQETETFKGAAYGLFRTNMKVTAALSSLPPLMELIGGVGMALALVYGSFRVTARQCPGCGAPGSSNTPGCVA